MQKPVELTNCDREPIHIPAAIQAFGCLVVVDAAEKKVVSVSSNAGDFSFSDSLPRVGDAIAETHPDLYALLGQLTDLNEGETVTDIRTGSVDTESNDDFIITAHQLEGLAFLEFEPQPAHESIEGRQLLETLIRKLDRKCLGDAYSQIVETVRVANGFDRVMLYQFHDDGHGSVIAEAKCDDEESFLGLHYPASDIPVPARRLYEKKWVRTIADSHTEGVPMNPPLVNVIGGGPKSNAKQSGEAAPTGGEDLPIPINMSHCDLRAISPIHLEYLRNMGVRSSMSISILNGGKLWGLIACHHRQPKVVPPEVRYLCELAGSLLSVFLTSRRQEDLLKQQVETNDKIFKNVSEMTIREHFGEAIIESASWITQLFNATGLVWNGFEDQLTWGDVPQDHQINDLLAAIETNENDRILFTDNIGKWNESFETLGQQMRGMLALRMGRRFGGTLLFFRPAYQTQISWAGDPHKSKTDESGRITPRKSFAKFTQSVSDQSQPWSDADRETADVLLTTFGSMVVEQSARIHGINEELRRLNADLDAFAYAASHDLKEPLRGVHHHLFMLEKADGLAGPSFDHGMSSLKRLTSRMGELLDGLLRFSRAGRQELNWETVSLTEVVEQARDVVFGGLPPSDVKVTVMQDSKITGDFACIREILSNLISNAKKYNEQKMCQIEVAQIDVSQTPLKRYIEFGPNVIYIKDNGIGISPDNRDQIFEIFTRLHGHNDFGGGSGAGLTIVRRMVERHGGKIMVESDGESGSTFYFGWEAE